MSGRAETTAVIPGRCIISVGRAEMPTPKGWEWFKLTDIARLESGHTPSRRHPEYWDGGVPWIGIKDARLHHGRVIHTTLQTISSSGLENSAARILPAGTVCLSRTASVGYTFVMGKPMATSQDFVNWVCSDRLIPEFFMYALIAEGERLREFGKGTTHTTIYYPEVKAMHICLPKPVEQRRIVAEIEKQFTRLDAGVAALRRTQANLKRYRAAVLKAACEGRLVPTEAELARSKALCAGSIPRKGATTKVQSSTPVGSTVDSGSTPGIRTISGNQGAEHALHTHEITDVSNYESGEQLLQHILAERRKNWPSRGKYKEPVASDESLPLPHVPTGWAIASIDQLAAHITSGSRDWSRFYGRGSGTFILAQNVRPMRLDMSERQAVDAPKDDAEAERTLVRQNDLLVTIVGAKTGDVCQVRDQLSEHYVCQSVALIRPVHAGTARFLELWLASQENGQALWKKYIYGQGRPHLSFEQIKATPVFLPPLVEQRRIVAEVECRLSLIDELETVVVANLARATSLRSSILSHAFSESLTR